MEDNLVQNGRRKSCFALLIAVLLLNLCGTVIVIYTSTYNLL